MLGSPCKGQMTSSSEHSAFGHEAHSGFPHAQRCPSTMWTGASLWLTAEQAAGGHRTGREWQGVASSSSSFSHTWACWHVEVGPDWTSSIFKGSLKPTSQWSQCKISISLSAKMLLHDSLHGQWGEISALDPSLVHCSFQGPACVPHFPAAPQCWLPMLQLSFHNSASLHDVLKGFPLRRPQFPSQELSVLDSSVKTPTHTKHRKTDAEIAEATVKLKTFF